MKFDFYILFTKVMLVPFGLCLLYLVVTKNCNDGKFLFVVMATQMYISWDVDFSTKKRLRLSLIYPIISVLMTISTWWQIGKISIMFRGVKPTYITSLIKFEHFLAFAISLTVAITILTFPIKNIREQ